MARAVNNQNSQAKTGLLLKKSCRNGRIGGEGSLSAFDVDEDAVKMIALNYPLVLRSLFQGMATFSMEFAEYRPLPENLVDTLE